MKHSILFFIGLLSAVTPRCAALKAVNSESAVGVLVVTGGHGFPREPFFKMLGSITNITYTHAEHGKTNATVFDRDDLSSYDALLLYDMPREITTAQKSKFLSLLQRGTGLLVLHHALVSYQHWPDYERIIGGRYPEEDGKGGVVTKQVGYEHDVDMPIKIADWNHPATKGLSDFTAHDEIYWGYRIGKDVIPLLTTTHAKSGNPIAWARQEQNSRIVFIQPGHGPQIFDHPDYRKLLAQSLAWIAKKNR